MNLPAAMKAREGFPNQKRLLMNSKLLLQNKNIVITAGPTREHLDPIRYISNDSSGKMGYALVKAAKRLGAKVTLISGPTNLKKPDGVKTVQIVSADQMYKATKEHFKSADIVISTAAVSDFRPQIKVKQKIKKAQVSTLKLTENPDILKELGKKKKRDQVLIGFALETENLKRNAYKKLQEKNCDMIVANSPKNISNDLANATIITRDKKETSFKNVTKLKLASEILKRIEELLD